MLHPQLLEFTISFFHGSTSAEHHFPQHAGVLETKQQVTPKIVPFSVSALAVVADEVETATYHHVHVRPISLLTLWVSEGLTQA